MELHHAYQPSHKKKWTEYLLEFFMLFLAVFLGFVAENIRENAVENHREKQFMKSLIRDLQLDTAYGNHCIQAIDVRSLSIDSALNYFIGHPSETKIRFSTVRQMRRSTWDQLFLENNGTFDQLRYSGGLRLIHNRMIVDSIEYYYQQLMRFAAYRQSYRSNQDQVLILQEKVFDAFEYVQAESHLLDYNDSSTLLIHKEFLNEYLNMLVRLKHFADNDKLFNYGIKNRAVNLIALIKKEYHLGDE